MDCSAGSVEREGHFLARHLTNEEVLSSIRKSATFHGQGRIRSGCRSASRGVAAEEFGPVIDDAIELESLIPTTVNDDGTLEASIIHIDRFGNCITNLTTEHLTDDVNRRVRLIVNDHVVTSMRKFFSEEADARRVVIHDSRQCRLYRNSGAELVGRFDFERPTRAVDNLTNRRAGRVK